jgi:SGNH domain-containing protein
MQRCPPSWVPMGWDLVADRIRRARALGTPARVITLVAAVLLVVAVGTLGAGSWTNRALTGNGLRVDAGGVLAEVSAAVTPIAATALPVPIETPLVTFDPRPPTVPAALRAQPAGRDLRPQLADARADGDGLIERGCGLSLLGAQPPLCVLGDPDGARTIALVGDSHAGHWFPALELVARDHHWRLIPLTKDSCTFLDMRIVAVYLGGREYLECARWRVAVVALLRQLQPDVVMVSSSRWVHPVFAIDADAGRQADAMARMLSALPGRVVLMADTPLSSVDVPACLARAPAAPDLCATAARDALAEQLLRDGPAAERSGATLIDPTPWFCGPQVCPAVIDSTIVYRDEHHVTATFSRTLAQRIDAALREILNVTEPAQRTSHGW